MAEANTQITVQFAGQKEVVQSDEHGKWRLNLPPLKVNDEPQVFKVYSEVKNKDNLVYNYIYKNFDLVKLQLFKAGVRLASTLNEIFDE